MATDPATVSSTYDEIPYGDHCFPYTHPDALATIGRLYGINTPRVASARVLELGCARGSNLIPMALELPEARFIGVDLSEKQIAHGRGIVEALSLRNIALEAMSIEELGEWSGKFDYIICHGVYSWVPPSIRDKILEICSTCLTETGVAYVSYNTFPGWHARGMVRELFDFHIRTSSQPTELPSGRVQKARQFLADLVKILPESTTAYSRILRDESEFLKGVADSYLFHEHLEEVNQPFYFRDFMTRAEAHGLQFLGEAKTPGLLENLPNEARAAIAWWADEDEIAAEQYLDFVCNRTFRRTLLCRAGLPRDRTPSADRLGPFSIGTNVAPVSLEADTTTDDPLSFRKVEGEASLSTNNPALKTALVALYQANGHAIGFEDLVELVHNRLGEVEDLEATLKRSLIQCFLSNMVELHVQSPRFAAVVAEKPVASPYSRLQAIDQGRVTSLRRRTVELNEFERIVLRLLDGEHDLVAIRQALASLVTSGGFTLYQGDEPLEDLPQVLAILEREVEPCLRKLADMALLCE